jgi:hypothetical protein
MANSYHVILSKNDRALVAYLIAKGAGTAADTWPAKSSSDKDLPHTVCWSERAVENPPGSCTYDVTTSILVKCNLADTSARQSDARVAAIGDAMHIGMNSSGADLAADITAAARAAAVADPENNSDLEDFTMQDILDKGADAAFDELGVWTDTLNFLCVSTPSNVS